jgi:cysteinyl-tRNA synthetase
LNTAEALAAVFDLVRDVNIAIDKGEFLRGDVAGVQAFLETFDRVFAVMKDDDAAKLAALGYGSQTAETSDVEIEKKIAQRQAARQRKDFAEADRIRKELAERDIILEDSRDGTVRWKRK